MIFGMKIEICFDFLSLIPFFSKAIFHFHFIFLSKNKIFNTNTQFNYFLLFSTTIPYIQSVTRRFEHPVVGLMISQKVNLATK